MEALATSSTCPECRGDGYRVEAEVQPGPGDGEGRRARAVARVCSCRERVPALRRTRLRLHVAPGRVQQEGRGRSSYEALAPCVCRLLAQRVSTFAQAGIPAHHATSSFATFRAKGDDQEKTAALEQALGGGARPWRRSGSAIGLRAASSSPAAWARGRRTCSRRRCDTWCWSEAHPAQYREISLLYADIRRGFNAGKSGGEIIARLVDADVLAIDELGRGRGSPFEMETLDELIARRYNSGLTTIVATNFSLERERAPSHAPRGFQAPAQALRTGRSCWWSASASASTAGSARCATSSRCPRRTDDFRRTKQDGRPTRRLVRPAS